MRIVALIIDGVEWRRSWTAGRGINCGGGLDLAPGAQRITEIGKRIADVPVAQILKEVIEV